MGSVYFSGITRGVDPCPSRQVFPYQISLPTMSSNSRLALLLIAALSVRLVHIDFPVGGFQSWRQADTAAIARNYYEHGFDFLSPQIDWGGNSPGYVETEFPIYPFLVALLYAVLGASDTIGRGLSVLFSLLTIVGVHALGTRFLGTRRGFIAAAVYAVIPLNIYYGRAFMPEAAMLMCSVWGVEHFARWIQKERSVNLIASAVFVALAALLKLPCLYLGLPILFLAVQKYGTSFLRQKSLWMFAVFIFLSVGAWYAHAHQIYQHSGLSFGIWFFGSDKWGMIGPLVSIKFWNDVLFKSIAERHFTYAGFVPFLIGLFVRRATPPERVFDWWLLAFFIFVLVVPIGNQVHDYYQLPISIPGVMFIAKGLDFLWTHARAAARATSRWIALGVLLLSAVGLPALSTLRMATFVRGEQRDSPLFELGRAADRLTQPDALVIAVDEGDPVFLYHARRKGWHAFPQSLTVDFVEEKVRQGARYLMSETGRFRTEGERALLQEMMHRYTIRSMSRSYFILKLVPQQQTPSNENR